MSNDSPAHTAESDARSPEDGCAERHGERYPYPCAACRSIAARTAENDAPAKAVECDHCYAWVSPAGTKKSARICQLCNAPDPEWLNHTVEVDLGHPSPCLHCEFAETRVIPPGVDQ